MNAENNTALDTTNTDPEIDARAVARATYALARGAGKTPEEAAQAAWMAVRALPEYRHLRAPCWDEQVGRFNTGCRRSYASPLGCILGVSWSGHYGQHSAKWPRTVSSLREAAEVRRRVIAALESNEEVA